MNNKLNNKNIKKLLFKKLIKLNKLNKQKKWNKLFSKRFK